MSSKVKRKNNANDRAEIAVSQWARERPELDGFVMGLIGRLTEAAQRVMREHIEPFMVNQGLNFGEFDVLATLRRAGSPYELSPTDLYRATMVTSGAMTGRIDRLEKLGLVKRKNAPDDRRSVTVGLTPKGVEFIDALMPKHVANEERLVEGLSRHDAQALYALLGKLLETLPPSDRK